MDLDIVTRSPLFAGLDEPAAAALLELTERETFKRGQVIFNEGDPGEKLYVIAAGKLKLSRSSHDGRENLLAVLGPGEIIGEISFFDPGPRTASAITVSDTEVLALAHGHLSGFLRDNTQASVAMLGALAHRLRRTNDNVADLVFTDVPGRVAKALLDLAERFGVDDGNGLLVQHELTQEELAQLVGASRETVNKALADFASRGWLRLEARSVRLLEVERLRKRAR
ncbi:Crp/Fnr family transcriptional regulator [Kytococcus sedentarius]|uniref:Crp/Fnr family transcriptional regulator n=1 Tax=Kytococcus sedentarius TaxID=1276 RepID=UPI00195090BF|nr:Crp/Fnr family transcriptional regulator [Kytococcus sedentarius]QRO87178.1 Crp/Fnr family transcriptional regulator [Kytococcus sedentarius]